MPQFTAYVFQDALGFRVIVDGLGSDSARSLFEAEDAARRMIECHLRASYPDRNPASPGEALGVMHFGLEIVRSDGRRERRELWLRAIPPTSRRRPPARRRQVHLP